MGFTEEKIRYLSERYDLTKEEVVENEYKLSKSLGSALYDVKEAFTEVIKATGLINTLEKVLKILR